VANSKIETGPLRRGQIIVVVRLQVVDQLDPGENGFSRSKTLLAVLDQPLAPFFGRRSTVLGRLSNLLDAAALGNEGSERLCFRLFGDSNNDDTGIGESALAAVAKDVPHNLGGQTGVRTGSKATGLERFVDRIDQLALAYGCRTDLQKHAEAAIEDGIELVIALLEDAGFPRLTICVQLIKLADGNGGRDGIDLKH
jgi:hypothetical protein